MPRYTITFEAQFSGECVLEAEDIRAAINSLDDDYFSQFDIDELSSQKYLITKVESDLWYY